MPVNTILHGDCLTLLPTLSANSAAMVLTDPPYLARYRDRSGRTVPNDDNDRWLVPAFSELYRVRSKSLGTSRISTLPVASSCTT
jgi:DNA modification methylase